jgi:hypothetical protein
VVWHPELRPSGPILAQGQSNAQDSFRDAEAGTGRLLELSRDAFLRKFVPNSFELLTHNLGQIYYDTAQRTGFWHLCF